MRRPVTGLSRSRERGAIAAVVAIAISALLTLLVLVMNVGHGYSVRAELQNAGDSAALAGVADIGGSNLAALSASLGTARATALTYAGRHTTDGTAAVGSPDVRLGIWHLADSTRSPWFEWVPTPGGNTVFQINAVQIGAARNAGQGGPLTVYGGGLLERATMDVVTSATAARFAPCTVTRAAPIVFTMAQVDAGMLPCEAPSSPLAMSRVGYTRYRQHGPVTAAWLRHVLTRGGVYDPRWYTKMGPLPAAPAGTINVQNGGGFAGIPYAALSRLQAVDVGIVSGPAPTSGTHSVTTWARVTVVGVNSAAGTITIRRECGESEQDATPVAGRCRVAGLLSTRPVLME